MSNQKPIADNLFTWPSDQPKLLGSREFEIASVNNAF